MDGNRFDGLARLLASGVSRRSLIKGLFAGGVGVVLTGRSIEAQVLCGDGTCSDTEVCCDDLNCCPGGGGYECIGAECCQTCEYFPGECGEIRAYCGNTLTPISCGCGAGLTCCNGSCEACCEDTDCESDQYCDSGTCMAYCEPGQRFCGFTGDTPVCGECCVDRDCVGPSDESCGETACVQYQCSVIPDNSVCGTCEQCDPTALVCGPLCGETEVCCGGENCCGGSTCCCDDGSCSTACCESTCTSTHDCSSGTCCCKNESCSSDCCEASDCTSDMECGHGSCCCKDGTCSDGCCPPKPGGSDDFGGTAATVQLPNTGSGQDGGKDANVIAAAVVAAGAAAIIGAKLKSESTIGDPPDTSKMI